MARRPVIFIHGYSADERDFDQLRAALIERGHAERDLHLVRFKSFSDEVSIRRLADALGAAITARLGDQAFDAVVHSTGALIIREWLRQTPEASARLRNLVAIAPANFGSPVSRRARSAVGWVGLALGRVRERDVEFLTPWSENFLDVGERLLRDLELASPISWDLAESEIAQSRWGTGDGSGDCPRVFTIGGLAEYSDRAMRRRRAGLGTDGTVRLAGMSLDVDRLRLDLRPSADPERRVIFDRGPGAMARPLFITDLQHQTVCTGGDGKDPAVSGAFAAVADAVVCALDVNSAVEYAAWAKRAEADTAEQLALAQRWCWQQFVVRMRDEVGEPVVCDWTLQLDVDGQAVGGLEKGAHVNGERPDLRCLAVPVTDQLEGGDAVTVRVIVDPGTEHFDYRGIGANDDTKDVVAASITVPLGGDQAVRLFRKMATTLIDIVIEGVPPDPSGDGAILTFVEATA